MKTLKPLFDNNREWAERIAKEQPGFFEQLSKQQSPECLWIGCADSRVPPSIIADLPPGAIFVHRNIANQVVATDPNCQSIIQYAVETLQVAHIVVCGHYGCGGIAASMGETVADPIDGWLDPIREIYRQHREQLDGIDDPQVRKDRLSELNTIAQVSNVCSSKFVENAWSNGQPLAVHGWMFNLADGLLKDLDVCVDGNKKTHPEKIQGGSAKLDWSPD